jgi:hypothetical protein
MFAAPTRGGDNRLMDTETNLLHPAYDPPYDSPIEEKFAWALAKYLRPEITVTKQKDAPTRWGNFRLDFLVTAGTRRVGVECDGVDYHDIERDAWRDAVILGKGHADVIYRFKGADIHYAVDDLMYLLRKYEPHLFTERGLINLNILGSDDAKREMDFMNYAADEGGVMYSGETVIISHPALSENEPRRETYVKRRGINTVPNLSSDWRRLYAFATTCEGNLEAVIARHRRDATKDKR